MPQKHYEYQILRVKVMFEDLLVFINDRANLRVPDCNLINHQMLRDEQESLLRLDVFLRSHAY